MEAQTMTPTLIMGHIMCKYHVTSDDGDRVFNLCNRLPAQKFRDKFKKHFFYYVHMLCGL